VKLTSVGLLKIPSLGKFATSLVIPLIDATKAEGEEASGESRRPTFPTIERTPFKAVELATGATEGEVMSAGRTPSNKFRSIRDAKKGGYAIKSYLRSPLAPV
jgi:hypothetical protein